MTLPDTQNLVDSVIKMTLRGRFDYTLVEPGQLKYIEHIIGTDYSLIPVQETVSSVWYLLNICENSEEGRLANAAIEKQIQALIPTPEWRALLLKATQRWGLVKPLLG